MRRRRPANLDALRAITTALVLACASALAGCDAPPPMPAGHRVIGGLPLVWAVSSNGAAVAAEVRGTHDEPGDPREQLWLAVAPFERDDAPAISLGRGATLPSFSDDGTFVAWLASKERGARDGPGRARRTGAATTGDAPAPLDLGTVATPILVGADALLVLTAYDASLGRGVLDRIALPHGRRRRISGGVLPGGFASLADGSVLAIGRSPAWGCRALRSPRGGLADAIVASDLDCEDARAPFRLSRNRDAIVFAHTVRGSPSHLFTAGAERLQRLARLTLPPTTIPPFALPPSPAPVETTIAAEASAWTLDARERLWWVEPADEPGHVRLRHEPGIPSSSAPRSAAPVDAGLAALRFPRAIYPVGEAGAWVLAADRTCAREPLPSRVPACLRLVAVGSAPPPPEAGVVRDVVSAPRGAFPLVLFAGFDTPPALLAIPEPGHMVPLGAAGLDAAISANGRYVAAVTRQESGSAITVTDVLTDRTRTLATGAPRAQVRFGGNTLFYTFATWRLWDPREAFDPRNGVYAVDPDAVVVR